MNFKEMALGLKVKAGREEEQLCQVGIVLLHSLTSQHYIKILPLVPKLKEQDIKRKE